MLGYAVHRSHTAKWPAWTHPATWSKRSIMVSERSRRCPAGPRDFVSARGSNQPTSSRHSCGVYTHLLRNLSRSEVEEGHRMRYRRLGTSGLKVSELGLGTWVFGAGGNPDHDECCRMIHRALDAGINLID